MSAHFLLMFFLCLLSGTQSSFQPAAYKSCGCEWYCSHRRRLPEGTPRSPGSGKILRQQNCHERFSLWFCLPDTSCGSEPHSTCICGAHPLFLRGRAFSVSWVRLSFLPPQGIEQPVWGTLCMSKCHEDWRPLKAQLSFLLIQRQKRWLCLPFSNLDLAQGKWPAHFTITGC